MKRFSYELKAGYLLQLRAAYEKHGRLIKAHMAMRAAWSPNPPSLRTVVRWVEDFEVLCPVRSRPLDWTRFNKFLTPAYQQHRSDRRHGAELLYA